MRYINLRFTYLLTYLEAKVKDFVFKWQLAPVSEADCFSQPWPAPSQWNPSIMFSYIRALKFHPRFCIIHEIGKRIAHFMKWAADLLPV